MRFSLITVCYNAGDQLSETIESVLAQTHADIEHIVIDGASPDESTQKVLQHYMDRVSKLVREADNGVYDAMNKGLALATGDVVGFVNAGDMLEDSSVISRLNEEFAKDDAELIYGDAVMVDPHDVSKIKRIWKGGAYDRERFRQGWMPPHLGTYIRREVYQRHGDFDLRLKIAADYELLFRFCYVHRVDARYIPFTIVRFRLGGASNRTVGHIMRANREVYQAWRMHGIRVSPLIAFQKPMRKLAQVLRAKFRS